MATLATAQPSGPVTEAAVDQFGGQSGREVAAIARGLLVAEGAGPAQVAHGADHHAEREVGDHGRPAGRSRLSGGVVGGGGHQGLRSVRSGAWVSWAATVSPSSAPAT